jgi:hypothetical protein
MRWKLRRSGSPRSPADLHDRVGHAQRQPAAAERAGQRGRHDQAAQGQPEQHQPDRDQLRVQPVGHPGGVGPDQPDHGEQQQRLQRAADRGVVDQVVRQLGDREHVNQVEEQLDVGDPGGPARRPPQVTRVVAGHGAW